MPGNAETGRVEKSLDALREKIIVEQFMNCCHEGLVVFLKERRCCSLEEVVTATDDYIKAHGQMTIGPIQPCVTEDKAASNKEGKTPLKKLEFQATNRCDLCDKFGHNAADCRRYTKPNVLPRCGKCRQGHRTHNCFTRKSGTSQASCVIDPQEKDKTFVT